MLGLILKIGQRILQFTRSLLNHPGSAERTPAAIIKAPTDGVPDWDTVLRLSRIWVWAWVSVCLSRLLWPSAQELPSQSLLESELA
jgi:hypothetical protein